MADYREPSVEEWDWVRFADELRAREAGVVRVGECRECRLVVPVLRDGCAALHWPRQYVRRVKTVPGSRLQGRVPGGADDRRAEGCVTVVCAGSGRQTDGVTPYPHR